MQIEKKSQQIFQIQEQQPSFYGSDCKQQLKIYVRDWIESLEDRELPLSMKQFETSYKLYKAIHKENDTYLILYNEFKSINIHSIKQQFNSMWQVIFNKIQPYIGKCFDEGSLESIYQLIEKNLKQEIFGKNYKLALRDLKNVNSSSTPTQSVQNELYQTKLRKSLSLAYGSKADTVFAQLFQILFETAEAVSLFYKMSKTDHSITDSAFEALTNYLKWNQKSQFIKKDLTEYQASKCQEKKETGKFLFQLIKSIDQLPRQFLGHNIDSRANEQSMNQVKNYIHQNRTSIIKPVQQKKWSLIGAAYDYAKNAYKYAKSYYNANNQLGQKQQRYIQNLAIQNKNLTSSTLRIVKEHLKSNIGLRKKKISQNQLDFLYKFCIRCPIEIISSGIRQDYKNIMIDAVTKQIDLDQCMFMQLKKQVIKELMSGLKLTTSDLQNSRVRIIEKNSSEKSNIQQIVEQWFLVMTLLYKSLQKKYDPYRRRMLKKIFKIFNKQNGLQIDTIAVLKLLQNQSVSKQQIPQILQFVRNDSDLKRVASLNKQKQQKQVAFSASKLAFQHQVNRIYLYEFEKKYEQQKIQFVRLSEPGKHNKVVNLLISGFMSQDTDKVQEWKQLVSEMPDSQIYSVCWASKTSKQMLEFIYGGVKDLLFCDLGILGLIGGPYVRALAITKKMYQKYQQNPFQPAFLTAKITGYYLAEIIISTLKGHMVNLMAFSLGTQVLRATLQRLNYRKSLFMVNKIVTMGGVADVHDFVQIFQKANYPLDATNLYSDRDFIIKYLYKISRPFSTPIGINNMVHSLKQAKMEIEQKQKSLNQDGKVEIKVVQKSISPQSHMIRNVDCSGFINGHTDFRANMKVVGKIIDARQQ